MVATEAKIQSKTGPNKKDLTGIDRLSTDEINDILLLATDYAEAISRGGFISDKLKGRMVLNLFFEASTRTRISFEIAAKRLGADVINWSTEASSLKKAKA